MSFDFVGAAWFVLDTSLRALAAAAAVALVLRVLRIRAAAVQHSAWSAVLVAMLLMPMLSSVVPALPIPVPASAGGLLGPESRSPQLPPGVVGYSTQGLDVINDVPSSRTGGLLRLADRPSASATEMRASRLWIPLIVFGVYAAGALLLIARLFYGWYLASAMIRRARRGCAVRVDLPARVYQSSEVIVPMTIGAIRPVIVLPITWNRWKADTLAAIIAHEAAHVRRRDASIALLAHLNRAVFWFHPLAWWLERKIAVTAEHACDEAAARAIAGPARYAEILVEMADVVRRNHGRLAWQGVGVNRAGLLHGRIHRLLRGDAFAGVSRVKRIGAAVGCVLAIATVIACRQQSTATPLREDPELAKMLADRDEQGKKFEAARDMTQEQADTLEQRVALSPEDFEARGQLVTYYRASSKVAWDKKVPGLRRHALWLIEHHPDHEVQAPALSPEFDPEGFAAAKRLWEAHLARPDASPFLVYRAASFFAPHDKPYAEPLILRGMAMDPDSAALKARMPPDVAGYQWPMQLASLYGAALRGSESAWGTYHDLRTHLDKVNSPYAKQVRSKLDATTDAALLARVGSILTDTRPVSSVGDSAGTQAVEQIRALGVRYLERALELDPNLESAKTTLVRMRLQEQPTDADRLANRAFEGYMVAEDITEYARKDMAAGKRQRDEAAARAQEVLKIAAAHEQDPAYSAAVMIAHHVLATTALRDGDREGAVHHMRESVKVPTSEQIQYAPPFSWGRPVNRLLKEGEREAVAEFMEALAGLTISERDRLLADAQAIRQGRMPSSYQRMIAREGH
jgi:beta-lactamase regulating signal transducer with metallopeptidase domain